MTNRIRILRGYKKHALKLIFGSFYHPNYFEAERKARKKIPSLTNDFSFLKRARCFISGFNSDKLIWYDFKKYDRKLYISDLEHYRDMERIGAPYYYVAHDKLVFEHYFQGLCQLVESMGVIHNGFFYKIKDDGNINNLDELIDSMIAGKTYFFKPRTGGSGRGIFKVFSRANQLYYNTDCISREQLKNILSELTGYLVQDEFSQTGFSHDIWPHTLNTIRVTTMLLPGEEPFVAWSFHRFGTGKAIVDNVASGGLIAPIEPLEGVMKHIYSLSKDGRLTRFDSHPASGEAVYDVKVPNWNEIVNLAVRLHAKIPFLPICGWDLVLSGEDVYVQELNYNPDIYVGQILGPLLLNGNVKRFYDYYIKK